MSRLADLLNLSNVPRWGIVPRLREQSVADHTFRVAVITWELAEAHDRQLTTSDFLHILCHDASESWTGDIAGLAKHGIPELQEGEAAVEDRMGLARGCPNHDLVKAADIIECISWAYFWILDPRKSYVVDRNTAALIRYCNVNGLEQEKAMRIVRAIIEDQGRCSTPDWLKK